MCEHKVYRMLQAYMNIKQIVIIFISCGIDIKIYNLSEDFNPRLQVDLRVDFLQSIKLIAF